jgi:tripartite-type tricarboxylate transporter receptor subunit TctC
LPTIAETLPGYSISQWYGVIAPAKTAAAVIDRLNKEIARAIANPKVVQQFDNLDADPTTNQPEQFQAFIKSEIDKWGKVIRAANIRIE